MQTAIFNTQGSMHFKIFNFKYINSYYAHNFIFFSKILCTMSRQTYGNRIVHIQDLKQFCSILNVENKI